MIASLPSFQTSARSAVALALVLMLALSAVRPVLAETAGQRSTRNIILGGVAAAVAVVLYNNWHHKQIAHNTVVGYTRDGGTVYADGRIVYPNGDVLYTANRNAAPCAWDGSRPNCGSNAVAYYPRNHYYNYRHGRHKGNDTDNRNQNDGEHSDGDHTNNNNNNGHHEGGGGNR